MKIFWGIYCVAHWYDVTAEMLRCLKWSKVERDIEIHATGTVQCHVELLRLLEDFGITAKITMHPSNKFELPAIKALWENAKIHREGKSCYIHSKGVTSPCPAYSRWRWMMENLILLEIDQRELDLDEFSAVGCAYKPDWNCFAGNWWCARNDWISELPRPSITPNRFALEKWVLHGCHNFKSLAKNCSGTWPNFPGEPCSSAYYHGIENLYRPALINHCTRESL